MMKTFTNKTVQRLFAAALLVTVFMVPARAQAQGFGGSQQISIVGVWKTRMVFNNGVSVDFGLALLKTGRFGLAMDRSDGQKFDVGGTWQFQNNRLVLTAKGKVVLAGQVTMNNANSFVFNDGKDRSVFTRVNVAQKRNPNAVNPPANVPPAAVPPVNPAAAPRVTMAGSTWVGSENLQGYSKLTFQFQAGGQAVMIDNDGTHRGTWVIRNNQAVLSFYNGTVVYRASLRNGMLSGSATNGRSTWTFSLRQQQTGIGS